MLPKDEKQGHGGAAAETLLTSPGAGRNEAGGGGEGGDMTCSSSGSSSSTEEGGRHHWGKKAEYILAAVGYCVGLGNIWRFPYICMKNGGGAFLIPFFVSLVICAMPVYFLEAALGQFNGKSCYHVWSLCPLFKGIGLSMNAVSFFCAWYYSMILAWTLIYLGHSFMSPLPWTRCDQPWNSPNCVTPDGKRRSDFLLSSHHTNFTNSTSTFSGDVNGTGMTGIANSMMSLVGGGAKNGTGGAFGSNDTLLWSNGTGGNNTWVKSNLTNISSTEEFWKHKVLEQTSGIDEIGGLPWHTCLALIVANLVIFTCVIRGIRSTGKVVYVTATLPYVLLAIMMILGITLPGSGDGILFYIKPDFSKLLQSSTWVDAFLQVFYSLGTGWGGLVTMGSYNKFKNNCMKDSIILTLCCEGTSVFGGFAIFAILGHMAHVSGNSIDSFVSSGSGLAFIVYPTAISYLPVPQLWGFLFFLMLFTLGLDTQFTFIETIMTTVGDLWFKFMARHRTKITLAALLFFTCSGMIFATRGGIYLFTLMDWYIAAFALLPQAALECIVVGWIYGTDRFSRDIELMLGRKPYYIFILSWKFICPAILMVVFVVTLVTFKPPVYGTYKYSTTAEVLSWMYAVVPTVLLFSCSIYQLLKRKGSFVQRVKSSVQPDPDWGPAETQAREKYSHEMKPLNV